MDKTVSSQMHKVLEDYKGDVKNAWNSAANKSARDAVSELKSTSPKRHGDYARSWAVKRETARGGLTDFIVHNSKHYQLTHLLENGHVIRNKKGTYGRTSGIKHIAPAEQKAASELPIEIERKL